MADYSVEYYDQHQRREALRSAHEDGYQLQHDDHFWQIPLNGNDEEHAQEFMGRLTFSNVPNRPTREGPDWAALWKEADTTKERLNLIGLYLGWA